MHKRRQTYLIVVIGLLVVIARSTVRVQLFGNRQLALFYMEIYIGNPPIRQKILVDTGSPLTTIKCSDCKVCIDKKVTNYNEQSSFTSKRLTCDSRLPICDESCKMSNNDGYCHFFAAYGDGTTVIGDLIEDQIRFSPSGSPFNAQFGCMKYQREFYTANLDGLLGISPNFKKNILNKWFEQQKDQTQFSVCLGEDGGYLDIGHDEQTYNYQTVLEYDLTSQIFSVNGLQSISYGQYTAQIDQNSYNILLIDTGSTYSYFPQPIFNSIAQKMLEICGKYEQGCLTSKANTCLSIILTSNQIGDAIKEVSHIFPAFQIKVNDHILTWEPHEYIYLSSQLDGGLNSYRLCIALVPSGNLDSKTIILGMNWMIGKRFKFNLKDQTISVLANQQCKYTSLQIAAESRWKKGFNNFISFVQDYIIAFVVILVFLAILFKDSIAKCGKNILPFLRRIPPFMVRLWRFIRRPRQPKQKKKPIRGNKSRRTSERKKKEKAVSPPKTIQLSAQSQQIQTSTIQQT